MGTFWYVAQLLALPLLFGAGLLLARRLPRKPVLVCAALADVLILGDLWLASRPDIEDAIMPEAYRYFQLTGQTLPLAFFLGILAQWVPTRLAARGIWVLLVLLVVRTGMINRWIFLDTGIEKESYFIRGVYRQSTGWSCGAACLKTILHHHGIEASEAEMAELALVKREQGTSIFAMAIGLRHKLAGSDWKVAVLHPEWDELRHLRRPLIVDTMWEGSIPHVAVLMDIEEDNKGLLLWLGDPLMGCTPLRPAAFLEQWKRNAIVMYKQSPFETP